MTAGTQTISQVSPSVISAALLGQESGGDPNAPISVDGAVGQGQITPATFAQYALPGEDINNPSDNLAVHQRIVDDLSQKFNGDPARVAVGYFSGPGNVAPPTSDTPWKKDKADGNGKTVSSYVSDVMGRIGNAVVPSAQAEEMSQTPQQEVAQDVASEPQQNPYDSLSDEQLLAEARKQGISPTEGYEADIGAQPYGTKPGMPLSSDAPIEIQPLSPAGQTGSNPYDNLSDEQLLAEAQKQGIKTQLPTGGAAYGGELSKALVGTSSPTVQGVLTNPGGALGTIVSGTKNVANAFSPLSAFLQYATNGQVDPSTESALASYNPIHDTIKGMGQSALGVLGGLFSPFSAANRAFVGNPLQNKTGIPSAITDFAMSMIEPTALSKVLGLAGEGADVASTEATPWEGGSQAQQPSALAELGGAQTAPNDALAGAPTATVSETSPLDTANNIGEVINTANDVTEKPPAGVTLPMSAGQATQNPELQRFEADALAGAQTKEAEATAMDFQQRQQGAVSDLLSGVGEFKPGGNPSDSVGSVVNLVKANEAIADNGVKAAYAKANQLSENLPLPAEDMQQNLVPQVQQFAKDFRLKQTTLPKAYDAMNDLINLSRNPNGTSLLEDGEAWRRSVSGLARNTTDPAESLAMRGLIGTYDNYMGDLATRLSGTGNQQTADAINAFKEAVASRRNYGQLFEGNNFVENLVNGDKSVDDLTSSLLGSGKNVTTQQGQLDTIQSLLRASGSQAPLVQKQLQNAYAQKIYDSTAGSMLPGTTTPSISLPKLQTNLENIFVKNRQTATALYGNDVVQRVNQVLPQLDLINSRQANVGNPSSSGYTALRLLKGSVGGLLSHVPGLEFVGHAISKLGEIAAEGKVNEQAAQTFSGIVPPEFAPVSPYSVGGVGTGVGVAGAGQANRQ